MQLRSALAAYATALDAVLPVLAQITLLAPDNLALMIAAVVPRSLKEPVGFNLHILRNRSRSNPGAMSFANRLASIRGVFPSLSVMIGS